MTHQKTHRPTRILAHHIKYDGRIYNMAIAEISADAKDVKITPYERETPGTTFVSGTVELIEEKGVITLKK